MIAEMTLCGAMGAGGAHGCVVLAWCDEAWAGFAVVACFNGFLGSSSGCKGELHYMGVRHAGDTPLEGFV